ncbi:MAG: hypothetical protein AAB691_03900 [Patescibacteria group bacterium]
MIEKKYLEEKYIRNKKSTREIAIELKCSEHKVNYWLGKHNILKRNISEAIYLYHNPNGDPFVFYEPKNQEESFLFGLGLGLYWGEGTKADKMSVRLGNTDPNLIKKFIEFLVVIFGIDRLDLRFGLQLFSDMNVEEAMDFWMKSLRISKAQFYKVVVTPSHKIGTYRKKTLYGVLTVYYHNKKLRDLLISKLPL